MNRRNNSTVHFMNNNDPNFFTGKSITYFKTQILSYTSLKEKENKKKREKKKNLAVLHAKY